MSPWRLRRQVRRIKRLCRMARRFHPHPGARASILLSLAGEAMELELWKRGATFEHAVLSPLSEPDSDGARYYVQIQAAQGGE
mgnify:CR=1 FL=1